MCHIAPPIKHAYAWLIGKALGGGLAHADLLQWVQADILSTTPQGLRHYIPAADDRP